MYIQIALIISVFLQFGAFFITISLIRRTKFNISWIMISIGFLLMALRRLGDLITVTDLNQENTSLLINEWLAVFISILMFIASFYIRQIFNLQNKLNHFRKENEAMVLSAIINTEEKERQKFAKELHDGLGPILATIKMALSAINKTVVGNSNELIIDKTENAINNAILTINEISNKLSPHILEHFGLEKAIKSFSDAIITENDTLFQISSNLDDKRFNYNTEVVLYRIIGELVTNTLKHASASQIDISLFYDGTKLELFYSDNGIGFNMKNKITKGMGLSNINSRVKSIDGEIEMHSKHKQGFFTKIALLQ